MNAANATPLHLLDRHEAAESGSTRVVAPPPSPSPRRATAKPAPRAEIHRSAGGEAETGRWRAVAAALAAVWVAATIAVLVMQPGHVEVLAASVAEPVVPGDVVAVAELALGSWLEGATTAPSPDLFLGSVEVPDAQHYASRIAIVDATEADDGAWDVRLLATVLTNGDGGWAPDGVRDFTVRVVDTAAGPRASGAPQPTG